MYSHLSIYRPLDAEFESSIMTYSLDILNCRLLDIPPNMLMMTTTYKWLGKCLKTENQIRLSNPDLLQKACVTIIQNQCLQSKLRVFKTIRLPLDTIYKIQERDDSVRAIHTIRDPRGMINSAYQLQVL